MSKTFQNVMVRKFGSNSSKWEGPVTLTMNGKNINWMYLSGGNYQAGENMGEMLMWTYGKSCRKQSFSFGTNKQFRIDITLKVPNQELDGRVEIGKPYAFAFQNKDDFDAASNYLTSNIGDSSQHEAACNLSSVGYGKDGFDKFKRDIFKGGGRKKRKSKTKRKTTKGKKIQKKKKTKKRRKSSKKK